VATAEVLMSTLDGGTLTVAVRSWWLDWETLGEGGVGVQIVTKLDVSGVVRLG
jgi:hypothetical protein